jgi:hypothetical protein
LLFKSNFLPLDEKGKDKKRARIEFVLAEGVIGCLVVIFVAGTVLLEKRMARLAL